METEKTILEKLKEWKATNPLKEAAVKFEVSYNYVWLIANGARQSERGKGKQIREWLETQV